MAINSWRRHYFKLGKRPAYSQNFRPGIVEVLGKVHPNRAELRELTEAQQTARIIDRFGGPRDLWRALKALEPDSKLAPSTVYKWLYPKERGGTGGIIPPKIMPKILKAARIDGIHMTVLDLYPGKIDPDAEF